MNFWDPFAKDKASGFACTNWPGVMSTTVGQPHTAVLPPMRQSIPQVSVSVLHGDRKVTMVSTCNSHEFQKVCLTSSSCPYSVCRGWSKDLRSLLNSQMAQVRSLDPVMRWHPAASRAMHALPQLQQQVMKGGGRRGYIRMQSRHACTMENWRLNGYAAFGVHKHIHNTMRAIFVTHKCTVHDACNRADQTCYSKCLLSTHIHSWCHNPFIYPFQLFSSSPFPLSLPLCMYIYTAHAPCKYVLWWYATRAMIFPFSSDSTLKLLSQCPADTSNLLEQEATNMAVKGMTLGANGAPM